MWVVIPSGHTPIFYTMASGLAPGVRDDPRAGTGRAKRCSEPSKRVTRNLGRGCPGPLPPLQR